MKFRVTPKKILILVVIILLIFIIRPISFLTCTYFKDQGFVNSGRNGYTNDASNLNETRIDSIVRIPAGTDEAIAQISSLINHAKAQGKRISIAGAQHSMGGHTIYPDGIVLDMKGFHYMSLDSVNNILRVGSGALWSEVIPFLDGRGKSIMVMQSNNSFSVGGSVSVNCHGWQANSPPIASIVESFRLINADGEIVNCSRQENHELFSLVLGGYGLFGVILDLQLKVADNKMYRCHQFVIESDDYMKKFDAVVNGQPGIEMAYGRININPDKFMGEAIITTFSVDASTRLQPVHKTSFASLRRTVFRGSVNSDYGKNLRWKTEKLVSSQLTGRVFSRNQLLNEGVNVFGNSDTGYTDILHEYFIPKDSVQQFIKKVKQIIPSHKADLLNITIRNVKRDDDTYMRYAREEVFGFVMLFNQSRDDKAETEMQTLTRKLIDAALACTGTYYLPYRLHATKEQLNKAYPQALEFFRLKKKYDPDEIFRNQFYETYGSF